MKNKSEQEMMNREPLPETVVSGDIIPNVQITPIGDWPHGSTIQHVTREACEAMVANWISAGSKEILVDFDHDAEHGESTEAAAWISNVRLDPSRGLVGDFRFTDVGATAIANRRFRFLSPCWTYFVNKWDEPDDPNAKKSPAEVTPTRLISVALTNKPNIPVAPLLNREPTGDKSVQQKLNESKNMNPEKIKAALGLAPEATEADILTALEKMKSDKKALENEREEAKKAAAEKEAEDFAEANAKKCNKEVIKAQYLANKEATIALVNAIATSAAPTTICNKSEAKTPTISNASNADEKILATYENMTQGEAKDNFLMANAIVINRARNARAAAK